MIKGEITCSCGQLFGFETEAEFIFCPKCQKQFNAKEHETIEPAPVEPTEPV